MTSTEPFTAPVVESLSVRVVVDSVFDQFMPKATHPMVAIEHVGRIRNNLNSTLAGEWGLSLHLESRSVGETGQYLLDFGYTSEVLLRNFGLLEIRARAAQSAHSGHGHRDHYGGLPALSRIIGTAYATICGSLPAARRLFARNGSARATRSRAPGVPRPRGARAAGVAAKICRDAACALTAPFTTGNIARPSAYCQHARRADPDGSLQRGGAARATCPGPPSR